MNSTALASIGVPAAKTLHATASELERSSIVQALMTGGTAAFGYRLGTKRVIYYQHLYATGTRRPRKGTDEADLSFKAWIHVA